MSTMKLLSCKVTAFTVAFIMLFSVLINRTDRTNAEQTYDFSAIVNEVACLINETRAEAGLGPLKIVPYLCEVSDIRARECVEKLSHSRPDAAESRFDTAIDDNIVPWLYAGENIAAGKSDPAGTFKQWMDSPTHRSIILRPEYTHFGIAMYYAEDDPNLIKYKYYWEAVFVGCDVDLEGQYIPERVQKTPIIYGDININGVVDTFDLITLEKFFRGETQFSAAQMSNADIYHDGAITLDDEVVLRKFLLGECRDLPEMPDTTATEQ